METEYVIAEISNSIHNRYYWYLTDENYAIRTHLYQFDCVIIPHNALEYHLLKTYDGFVTDTMIILAEACGIKKDRVDAINRCDSVWKAIYNRLVKDIVTNCKKDIEGYALRGLDNVVSNILDKYVEISRQRERALWKAIAYH